MNVSPMRAVLLLAGICLGRLAAADSSATRSETLETWGWLTAQRQNLAGVELTADEREAFLRGAANQLAGRPAPVEVATVFAEVERLAAARREKLLQTTERKNREEADAFFATERKKPGVVALPDGLCYEVLRPGAGATARPRQTVNVHYTGRLLGGTEFVQMGPYDVVLVPNRLSPALFVALQKIPRGGAIRLFVPPHLAGDETRLGIPRGAATVFEIEILGVADTSAEDLANALLPPAPEAPAPPPSGRPTRELIETWGWLAAQQLDAAAFALSSEDIAAFSRGLAAGIGSAPAPRNLDALRPAVQNFIISRRAELRRAVQEKRRAAAAAFFATLKQNPAVHELPDGLRYEILQVGAGPAPRRGQIVIVNYTGRLLDGTVFDRTDNEPLHIEVGSVIDGWNEGIQKIGRGGRIRLFIPSELGYGEENVSGVLARIPGGSVLIYEIDLLGIEDATPGDRK